MSVVEILDNVLMQPLMLLWQGLFLTLLEGVSPGFALILMGVVVNLLLLPLYFQMEQGSRAARDRRSEMDAEEARYKAHYRGRERYFYIRALHRQYGHHPIKALFTASDLFLQIVVFSTVYRYLIAVEQIQGVPFLGIADLGRPDGLLWGVHVLPLLMTAANIASVLVYVDEPGKRRHGLALAALFLALLYSSPSGLVLYWTTSSVFSWVRNVVGLKLVPMLPSQLRGGLSRLASQV